MNMAIALLLASLLLIVGQLALEYADGSCAGI